MLSKFSGIVRSAGKPLRVIALGDSVTANDSFLSAGGLWSQGNGYFEETLRSLGGGYTFLRNAGVSGNTAAEMLARVDKDVIAYHPDLVFLMAGTNDILPGMTDAAYAAFFDVVEKTIVKLLLAGIDILLYTCPAKDAAPNEVSRAIPWFYMLAKHYGLSIVDAHRATVDPATGTYKAGYSNDGTHPNAVGIEAIVAAPTAGVYKAAVVSATVGGDANMIANGNFEIQSAPPAVDAWGVNTDGAAYTLDVVQGIAGKVFDYGKFASGGVYALYGAAIDSGFSDGDVLVFSGLFNGNITQAAPPEGYTFLVQFDGGDSFRLLNGRVTALPTGPGLFEFSMEAVVPAGYAGHFPAIPQLYVQDGGTYKAAELTLWNRTKYEAIWKPGSLLA